MENFFTILLWQCLGLAIALALLFMICWCQRRTMSAKGDEDRGDDEEPIDLNNILIHGAKHTKKKVTPPQSPKPDLKTQAEFLKSLEPESAPADRHRAYAAQAVGHATRGNKKAGRTQHEATMNSFRKSGKVEAPPPEVWEALYGAQASKIT